MKVEEDDNKRASDEVQRVTRSRTETGLGVGKPHGKRRKLNKRPFERACQLKSTRRRPEDDDEDRVGRTTTATTAMQKKIGQGFDPWKKVRTTMDGEITGTVTSLPIRTSAVVADSMLSQSSANQEPSGGVISLRSTDPLTKARLYTYLRHHVVDEFDPRLLTMDLASTMLHRASSHVFNPKRFMRTGISGLTCSRITPSIQCEVTAYRIVRVQI